MKRIIFIILLVILILNVTGCASVYDQLENYRVHNLRKDNQRELEKQYNDAFLKAFPLTPDECFKKSN